MTLLQAICHVETGIAPKDGAWVEVPKETFWSYLKDKRRKIDGGIMAAGRADCDMYWYRRGSRQQVAYMEFVSYDNPPNDQYSFTYRYYLIEAAAKVMQEGRGA